MLGLIKAKEMQFCAFLFFNSNELRGTWNILCIDFQLESNLKQLDSWECQLELEVVDL